MLKNYLKIAFRSLLKNKVYTAINILGLSVGLACCVLILLHVQDELSYDEFHPGKEDIYRVALERIYPDHTSFYALIPSGFSETFAEEIPEVRKSTRLLGFPNFTNIVEYKEKVFEENYVFFADSNFFAVFDFEILQGNPGALLKNPDTVILTESTARKYFGNENPVGKMLEINNNETEVVGVMQDVPVNSHMKFDFLSSSTSLGFIQRPNYLSFSSYTYLELAPGTDPQKVEAKIPDIVRKYASGQIERDLGISYQQYVAAGNGYNYFLQPITGIHLGSNLQAEIKPNSSMVYVYIFVSIAVLILLIACINFVNLATARSAERAREVGVRKVMGSDRSQLIRQFLTESVFITLFSLVLAIGFIQIILPYFNNLAQKELALNLFGSAMIGPLLFVFALVVGLLAGLYPAFYISSMKPVEVMKGKLQSNGKGSWLRNGLVVFQFAISIILISGTMVVNSQMDYIRNKRLGFDKENVLVVERLGNLEQPEAFKQKIKNLAAVKSVGAAGTMPGDNFFGIQFQRQGDPEVFTGKGVTVDDHFIETMGITLKEGRSFSEGFDDSLNVILNEAAVKAFGLKDPVGARLSSTRNVNNEQVTLVFTVIGVAENFNFESLRTPITSLALLSSESAIGFENFLTVRLATSDFSETIGQVEDIWKAMAPDRPFSYSFLDNDLAELYKAEQTSAKIFAVFAVLAIIIACVGLFGLAAYMAYQRTKEIGVRKVLGATVPNIVLLLSKDFARLVGIAFLIAVPVAWLTMQSWLQNFAFRIEPGIMTFVIAGLIALAIALLTVSYQAISAAVVNPVKSLRSE